MTRSKLILIVLGAAGLLLAASCKGGDGGTLTKEQALEKSKAMMEQVGQAAEKNKGNCEGFANAMKKIIEDNRGMARQVEALKKDPAAREWLEDEARKLMVEMMPKLAAMMELGMKCKDNEAWKKVNEEFKKVMQ